MIKNKRGFLWGIFELLIWCAMMIGIVWLIWKYVDLSCVLKIQQCVGAK